MKRTLFCILALTCFLLSACADSTNTASNTSSSAAPVLHKTKSGITYQVFDKPISDKVSLDYTVLAKDQDPLIITVTMIDESDESKGLEYHGYTLRENGWEDTALPWGSAFNKQFPQGPSFICGDSNGLIYISVVDPQKGIRLFQMGNSEDYKEIDLSEINKAYKDYELVDIQFVTDEEIAVVLQESADDATDPTMASDVVLFDLVRQKIIDKGSVISKYVTFAEDGTYYAISISGQYIQHHTIHDKMPDRVIQCLIDGEGLISETTAALGLQIADDIGYIVTSKGICSGKLSDKIWNTLVLPAEDLYYNENDKLFHEAPFNSIYGYAKLPGDNGDFIVSTLLNSESVDYQWVRYSL